MTGLLPARGPARLLAAATGLSMIGYGVYLTAGVLYFTRVVHLSAAQVGIGLTLAGALALAVGVPAGHLADARGARGVYAAMCACGAVAMAGLCLARGFLAFLLFASLTAAVQAAVPAARGPLVTEYGGERPAAFRAYLRSVTNAGIAVGASLAGLGIAVGTRRAYLVLFGGSAVAWVACAATAMLLPRLRPGRTRQGPRWVALHDRPYLVLVVLEGVMAIQYRVLTTAVPLWLLSRTAAPRWSISAVMLVNTGIVIFGQVRASKNVDTPQAGARAFRRAGFGFLASCVLFSALAGLPAWLAVTLLLSAAVVHTMGEIWHAAGGFELSFALAPPHAVGQYQGLFGMGLGLGVTAGPALLIGLCIGWGTFGWWTVGAMFAVTGLVTPAAVRWAERERQREQQREHKAQRLTRAPVFRPGGQAGTPRAAAAPLGRSQPG
jgi:hypothetical protein